MEIVNLTSHDVVMNDGRIFKPSGKVARLAVDEGNFKDDIFLGKEKIVGLPRKKKDTYYIVSYMVMKASDRDDLIAPMTRHKDAVKLHGDTVSVPGFIKNTIMGVRLSKKYGVNPSVQHCRCCGNEMGIILFGSSYKGQAPKNITTNAICDNCSNVIKQGGVFFIEVKDGESGNNPYRTGRLTAITKDCCNRIFKGEVNSINYMEETLFSKLFNEQFEKNGK